MRSMLIALVAVALVGMVGCAGVDMGKQLNGMQITEGAGAPVAHINANSWGFYFLPIFPLIVGDTTRTQGGIAFLMDTCKVEPVVNMLTRAAKEQGATKVVAMNSAKVSFWIPPFFWYKSCEVSGNAVK